MRLRRQPAPVSNGRAGIARPALVAAADRARDSARRGGLRRLDQEWQREAMRCYRDIGECWNPAQYYSRALERIRFFPARLNERGRPIEITEGPVLDLFNRIRSPGGAPGDLSQLAGVYGRLQFVIGDGNLTVSSDDGEEVWEYLSPMELRIKPDDRRRRQEYYRLRAPGNVPEDLSEAPDADFEPVGSQVRVWRLWRPHPEFSQWADSPIRPVINLYQLLERLTWAAYAEASSRVAQRGAFFWPNELTIEPADPTMDDDPTQDPVMRELQTAGARAIQNPDSAEAMMPFLVRGPGVTQTAAGAIPTRELLGYLALGPDDRYPELDAWDNTIGRIAGSIDMPKELLTGVGDVSHWGQWFLDDVGFRQHTGPTVIRFCNDIASAYLRPAAVEAGGIEDPERVTVWFDAAQAINHPDQTGTALKAHDQLVISDAALLEELGFPESAAPTDDELVRRIAVKLRQFPSDLAPEPQAGETRPQDGGRGGDVNGGEPPRRSRSRSASPPSPEGPSLSQMIVGAAMMQIDWSRERAGNRLKPRAQSCAECMTLIEGVASPMVASVLGRQQVLEVLDGHGSELALVAGTADRFAARLREWGVDGGWPEQLGQMVEQHALRTLYETVVPPLPPGFRSACAKATEGAD